MKRGLEILHERGARADEHDCISAAEFARVGMPLVVACTDCGMTMCSANALVAEDGHTFCDDCAPHVEAGG